MVQNYKPWLQQYKTVILYGHRYTKDKRAQNIIYLKLSSSLGNVCKKVRTRRIVHEHIDILTPPTTKYR